MSEQTTNTGTLADLKALVQGTPAAAGTEAAAAPRAPQRDALGRSYATGRRKNAIARVWIKPG
ncbi:MAG: 30S ribosomal protein S9, partial [Acetobacteraceae bacterium]|nr:30S ribosomal protein S9 [Acetobacteraceae bacterium]